MFSFVVFCSFRSSDKLSSFCNFPISFLTFQLSVQDNSFLFLIMRFHFLKSLGYWQKNYVSNSNLLSMYCLHYVWFCFFWYYHCLKRVRNRSFSGLYFTASEKYGKSGKIRTRKTPIRTLFTQCASSVFSVILYLKTFTHTMKSCKHTNKYIK